MEPTITATGRIHLKWALVDGVGPLLFSRLLVQFGDAETALGASAGRLAEIRRVGPKSAEQIARGRDAVEIDAEIAAAADHDVRIICREDEEYPPGLRQIADAPIVLYVKGQLQPTDAVAIAVVGTRRCSIYGGEQARRFGELLAGAGFTVVSGLARGIDALAQHGAVDAGGRSIAVMGKGLSEVYPPENQALAERLLENGAWLSELPMQAEVRRENFPGRNRIIAGMTLGTLVIEAPQRSGALITARLANEYNREVFAVPGRAQDPLAFGTNELIQRGYAKLTTCLEDILDELGEVGERMRPAAEEVAEDVAAGPRTGQEKAAAGVSPAEAGGAGAPMSSPRPKSKLSEVEQRVYEATGYEPIFQDAVLRASQLPPGEVLAAFTSLELKGLIKRLPGQLVVRAGRA
jgi:DNA processing protein